MNLFENLLSIKTGKENHLIKAVYVPNAIMGREGTYYLYYYDMLKNTFYINDLDFIGVKERASAINIIEHIVNKAYKQEMNSYLDIIRKIHSTHKPKVYSFYRQKQTRVIIIDRVSLIATRDNTGVITGFKNPSWDTGSEKYKDGGTLLCKIEQ